MGLRYPPTFCAEIAQLLAMLEVKHETWYIYTLVYNGESYFADQVFHLTDDQKELAGDYAQSLSLFLSDGSI